MKKSGTRHGARRLWLIAVKPSKRNSGFKTRKAISIIMHSAFCFFTLEQITSRLNTFCLPKSASRVKMVYGLMVCSLGLTPRALSVRLCGSSLAACPSGLSPEYAHSIARKTDNIYSKKKNNNKKRIFGGLYKYVLRKE